MVCLASATWYIGNLYTRLQEGGASYSHWDKISESGMIQQKLAGPFRLGFAAGPGFPACTYEVVVL